MSLIDERFLTHRLKSTSYAGITGGVLSILLFEYRYWHDHKFEWDLLGVGLTFVAVKLALMVWYHFKD